MCKNNEENYCRNGMTGTYNARFTHEHSAGYSAEGKDHCEPTYGGYSRDIVCDADYTLKLDKSMPLDKTAPLLCAGITVYSPMMYYGVKKGMKIAVAGLGGLGSMAVKFGVAMGCHVTVISRGTKKKDDAMAILGAHAFVDSTDAESFGAAKSTFTHIVDTIAAKHDLHQMMDMLDINGKLIMVGLCPEPLPLQGFSYIVQRKSLVGSLIGGIKETQEMLDFCAEKKIYCETEVVKPEQINEAYERAVASDVKYRFSIDCSQL